MQLWSESTRYFFDNPVNPDFGLLDYWIRTVIRIVTKILITWSLPLPRNFVKIRSQLFQLSDTNKQIEVKTIFFGGGNKKAVLSQRWPHNAPYTWVPWKFSGLPDYAHGYYSRQFSRAFVRIDPLNDPIKFEVRTFIRSWDNRGYPKNLDSPWVRPRSLFSKILNRLLFRLTL